MQDKQTAAQAKKQRIALEAARKKEERLAAERAAQAKNDAVFLTALRIIFAASFLFAALYYELACAAAAAALMGLLIWRLKEKRPLCVRLNAATAAIGLIWLFYLLSAFWAVDRGLAFWGAVKYLPAALFALCALQCDANGRRQILSDIPLIGAVMTVASFVLGFIPVFSDTFFVNGRLAGFFAYPNTFACFVLIGIVILIAAKKEYKYKWLSAVCFAILLFALLEAGSRSVYIIAIPAIIAAVIVGRRKKLWWFAAAGAAAALITVAFMLFADLGAAERITSLSASSSTLLGRLLYWKDVLPVILKHPFGLGYLGYYTSQGSFQSGLYSVRWVHNDLLQLFADVGWIPAAAALIAAVKAIFSKRLNAAVRIVLLVLLAHCMFDFDLEFVSMYFVLILCLDLEGGKEAQIRPAAAALLPFACAAAALSVWIGISSTLTYAGFHSAAAKVYPWNTLSNAELLTQTDDIDELEELADKIIRQNEYIALAWNAKALVSYSNGVFGTYITLKEQAISLNRYSIDEYEDYFEKLAVGVELYTEAEDEDSAQVCLEKIEGIQDMLDELKEQTSALAFKLADEPVFTMSDEYYEYLEEMY